MILYHGIRNSGNLQGSVVRFLLNYKGERFSKCTNKESSGLMIFHYLVPLIIVEAELSSAFFL